MATSVDESTVHSRELGFRLRECRERTGMSAVALAGRIGISPALTSRIETGKRGTSDVTILRYLAACGEVEGDRLGHILSLYHQVEHDYYLRPQHDTGSDDLLTLAIHETTAAGIYNFEPVFIPGLLQTPDYMRALFTSSGRVPAELIEKRVQRRVARQAVLDQRRPPQCTFVINEGVLRTPVGGDAVMHDQLADLVFQSDRRHCSIRLLPFEGLAQCGINVSFRLMTFQEHGPVAHVDILAASVFLDRPEDIALYQQMCIQLDRLALGEAESRALLVNLANSYDRPKAEHDDSPATGSGGELA